MCNSDECKALKKLLQEIGDVGASLGSATLARDDCLRGTSNQALALRVEGEARLLLQANVRSVDDKHTNGNLSYVYLGFAQGGTKRKRVTRGGKPTTHRRWNPGIGQDTKDLFVLDRELGYCDCKCHDDEIEGRKKVSERLFKDHAYKECSCFPAFGPHARAIYDLAAGVGRGGEWPAELSVLGDLCSESPRPLLGEPDGAGAWHYRQNSSADTTNVVLQLACAGLLYFQSGVPVPAGA